MTPEELIEAVSKMTPGEWTAMDRPPPSRVDHGWRAVAFIGQRLMVAVPADVMFEHSGPGTSDRNAAGISALKNHAVRIIQTLLTEQEKLASLIHYPECWDTAAYPTFSDALHEIGCCGHPAMANVRDAGPTPYSGRTTRREG